MKLYSVKRILSDTHFMAAILAAMVFWLLLYWWQQPEPVWLWPIQQWQVVLQVVLLYPLLEEWLFRGYLQSYLLRQRWGQRRYRALSNANLVTSLLFTGAHFLFHPPLAAAGVFIPSLIFGYFRERHQRLLGPVVLHSYYNLGYFWLFS